MRGNHHATTQNELPKVQEKLHERHAIEGEKLRNSPDARRVAPLKLACTSPLKAYQAPGGGITFSAKHGYFDRHLELPCGQCMSCRIAKMRDWAIRAVHEAQMHEQNAFITLTYNEDNLPLDNSIDVKHWQKFAKRLRKKKGPFRFIHCGEYGGRTNRPHYHACLFGIDFSEDRYVHSEKEGHVLWTSPELNEIWGKGFCLIGPLNYDTAAYTARYTLKKITGPKKEAAYERVDTDTGEITTVKPEYATMSRRPGLGQRWFEKYHDDVYPDDEVVINGKTFRPPKYYDGLLEIRNEKLLEEIKKRRRNVTSRKAEEETYERRNVRNTVLLAKLSQKKSEL